MFLCLGREERVLDNVWVIERESARVLDYDQQALF